MTTADGPGDGARDRVAATPGRESSTVERWRVIQRLVDAALDLPRSERDAYLAQSCGSDAGIYESASRLLAACDQALAPNDPLAGSAAAFAAPMLADLAARDAADVEARHAAMVVTLQEALAGRYTVERELGRGGMAIVYLARDLRHDRAVAVKVLGRDVVAPAGAERFLHEIRITARLTHPHVLGVHDSGEVDGLLYYVMPYVEGETLRARLARERALPLADAVRIIRELADALAYAHGRGVVHRDLKPENVLLSGGHAVVADFGIAKAIANATHGDATSGAGLTSAGVALGTPAYMAPEQAVGDASTDHRADLYALGVVAYEALAGAHPFGGRTPQALVAAHLTEPPIPVSARRPDTPPALAALVMQLLAKDPDARPQSADDVLRALDAAVSSPIARPLETREAPAMGRRWGAVAAALALLLAAGVAGYALWGNDGASSAGSAPAMGGSAAAPSDPQAIRTLAVLPFENTSGVASDDYFSDGMTDELAHALARLPGLHLAGRTSSYTFKGKAAPAEEVGRILDVAAFVSGTVRRAGDRLRVTTQLVSTASGKVVWDSVLESRSGDVFAVQDELTRAIVGAIAPALGVRPAGAASSGVARGTADAEAYDLYLKGRYYWLERGEANVVRSIEAFRQAIAKDPRFARAHAGLALAYATLGAYAVGSVDSLGPLTSASAERAVALDSTFADGQLAMGLAFDRRLRIAEAEARYRAAVTIEPSNASARHVLGFFLMASGRTDEGIVELQRAVQLDPFAKSAGSALAAALVFARRFPEGEAAARRVLAIDPNFPIAIATLGFAQAFGGRPDSAVRTLERGLQVQPNLPGQRAYLIFAYAAAGRWADAERLRANLNRPGVDASGGTEPAFAELVFGDPEPLVRLLTTRAGQRSWWNTTTGFGCNPMLDPLWADARFVRAMQSLGIAPCELARRWS
ncbi:MAG TPA: protein kinase, partial [Gemmatimonadaceae bacterium]|nr:protein kinase [Gemmatimonadaceae bacterium]